MFSPMGIPDACIQVLPPSDVVYTPGSPAPATAATSAVGDSTTTDSIPPMFSLLSPMPPPSCVQLPPPWAVKRPPPVAA
jgi:hypothetical protein